MWATPKGGGAGSGGVAPVVLILQSKETGAMALQLCLILHLVAASLCAVQQSTPELGVGGFLPDRLYQYDYRSVATVYHDINVTMQAQVIILGGGGGGGGGMETSEGGKHAALH